MYVLFVFGFVIVSFLISCGNKRGEYRWAFPAPKIALACCEFWVAAVLFMLSTPTWGNTLWSGDPTV